MKTDSQYLWKGKRKIDEIEVFLIIFRRFSPCLSYSPSPIFLWFALSFKKKRKIRKRKKNFLRLSPDVEIVDMFWLRSNDKKKQHWYFKLPPERNFIIIWRRRRKKRSRKEETVSSSRDSIRFNLTQCVVHKYPYKSVQHSFAIGHFNLSK